ncbi:hypothetical protein ACIGFK_29265 [Streptomyces sp. NPDC085524]|uniref:hypothetical protein n=1 Tax=unclassified Streptomyces TaxID=2593676 RepID=UPI0035D7FE4C
MNEFDFLVGSWDVTNRWRTDFLDPESGWEEFPGVSRVSRHFDGGSSFDEIDFPTKGFGGLTLRLFDREREEWSLYWSSRRTGTLFPPVVGRFTDGHGIFEGEDAYGGKPVRVRFVWSGTRSGSPRWEQFFSVDGGESWLLNWTMDFTGRP